MQQESTKNFNKSTTSFSNSSCILGVFEQRDANIPTIPESTYKNNYNMSWGNQTNGGHQNNMSLSLTTSNHGVITYMDKKCGNSKLAIKKAML
jgi:hypothetical protein